jgi:hypothetical protein
MKKLHEFKISIETEVEKTEVKNENEQEITVKTKVKEPVFYNIFLKQPARGENDKFRLFYGSQIKRAIDAGLISKSVLVNKHIDGAGALLSQETAKRIASLTIEAEKIRNELIELGSVENESDEKKKKQSDSLSILVDIQRELQAIETSNQAIFQNTAESYAQERGNLWLIFYQTYIEKDGKYEQFFKGNSFEEKENYYFDLEEKSDPVYIAAKSKLALFWGLYSAGRISTPEEFEQVEKEFLSE